MKVDHSREITYKPIYENEMMEILHALKKWHPYLIGRHFKVKTDHDSIKYFLEQRLSWEEQKKWVTNMLCYDFEIIYKKREENFYGRCTLNKGWRCWGLSLCYLDHPTRLDNISKGWMEEWRKSVDSHSKVVGGFQCIRYIYMGKWFTMVQISLIFM